MPKHLVVSIMSLAVVACTPAPFMASPGPSRDVLFAPEIVQARVLDTYQAVSQLRPEFLKLREPFLRASRTSTLRVFLDEIDVGGVDALRTIPIDQVTAIRYISATDAQFRWGGEHPQGVILVSTTRIVTP